MERRKHLSHPRIRRQRTAKGKGYHVRVKNSDDSDSVGNLEDHNSSASDAYEPSINIAEKFQKTKPIPKAEVENEVKKSKPKIAVGRKNEYFKTRLEVESKIENLKSQSESENGSEKLNSKTEVKMENKKLKSEPEVSIEIENPAKVANIDEYL